MTFRNDPADLQIGPPRQIDQAVAISIGKIGDTRGLRRGKPAATWAKANHKAIARRHRAQRAGAPAFDLEAVHDASRKEAAMELRPVTQSNASCRRGKEVFVRENPPRVSRRR